MKNLVFLFALLIVGYVAQAQPRQLTSVTVEKVETKYIVTPALTKPYENLAIQVKCNQLGGTTDGKIILQETFNGVDWITHKSADTLTMTANKVHVWKLPYTSATVTDFAAHQYRLATTGTINDTTRVDAWLLLK